jgi:hypothetical protein
LSAIPVSRKFPPILLDKTICAIAAFRKAQPIVGPVPGGSAHPHFRSINFFFDV